MRVSLVLFVAAMTACFGLYWQGTQLQRQLVKTSESLSSLDRRVDAMMAHLSPQTPSNPAAEAMLEPFRKVALELHPGMDPASAVSKLALDLQTTPMLPSRWTFRPLNQTSRSNLVNGLRRFQADHEAGRVRVWVEPEEGSKNRKLLADELVSIFNEGSLDASLQPWQEMTRLAGTIPPSISLSTGDITFLVRFASLLRDSLGLTCHTVPNHGEIGPGLFIIRIQGEPMFLPDGSVTFR
jgi:hypothetical protein